MENCGRDGVFHIDGTYKIIKNRFPLLVFGITDLRRTFHPIVFNITSHETESDFIYFYKNIIKLWKEINIDFYPEYIMQDACDASLNAARLCFKNSTVLMCYFHVMQNIKKHQNLISSDLYDDLLVDLRNIHYLRNENEYNGFIINFDKKI